MIKNKKGNVNKTLATLIIIFILIAVIDLFVIDFINNTVGIINNSATCLDINIEILNTTCGGTDCIVSLKESGTKKQIDGVILSFTGPTSNFLIDSKDATPPITDLKQLQAVSINATNVITNLGEIPNKVEVTAYFKDSSGTPQLCSESTTFNF